MYWDPGGKLEGRQEGRQSWDKAADAEDLEIRHPVIEKYEPFSWRYLGKKKLE